MKYDRILRGGTLVDGTGAPGRKADLAMKDGRVFFPEAGAEAEEVLDVGGLVVCPGFIDIHSHSDICPLVPYLPESKLYQGATSELCGNCGISILPCNDERREEIENYCASELEIPMLGTKIMPMSVMRAIIWASWPAPLIMRRYGTPTFLTASSTRSFRGTV